MNGKWKIAAAAVGGVVVTLAAGGMAFASMDKGLGRFGNADANNDGQVTQAEWLGAATKRFQQLDANKDGKLAVGELPPRRDGRWRGHGGHGRHGSWRGADAPSPDAPAAAAAAPGNAAAPVAPATK